MACMMLNSRMFKARRFGAVTRHTAEKPYLADLIIRLKTIGLSVWLLEPIKCSEQLHPKVKLQAKFKLAQGFAAWNVSNIASVVLVAPFISAMLSSS